MSNNNNEISDSEEITLSVDTLAALNEFLITQYNLENFEKTDEIPQENWQVYYFLHSSLYMIKVYTKKNRNV